MDTIGHLHSACMYSGPVEQHASPASNATTRSHSTGTLPSERPRSELVCHQCVTLVEIAAAEDIALHRDLGVLPGQTVFSGGAGTGNRTPDLLITSDRLIVGAHHGDCWPDRGICLITAATSQTGARS